MMDAAAQTIAPPSRMAGRWRRFFRDPVALLAALVLLATIVVALFAPHLTHFDPYKNQIMQRLKPPVWVTGGSAAHPLGTDEMGRDLLTRLIYGARISLVVALTVPIISALVGVTLGLTSGLLGGWVDTAIMTVVDIALTFPFLVLALALIGVLGQGLRNIILVLGLTGWPSFARLVRGQVLEIREREYVGAARALGAENLRIAIHHVLPNLVSPIIVLASLETASAIIAESSLSFLGLGIPTPIPSWGTMLAGGKPYIETAWWMALFPGLFILVTSLCLNIIGDRVRDVLDPKLEL
ncbi:MAG: ABC transporter permease [Mycobacterium leprae]